MLRIEKTVTMSPAQYEIVIEGMRNPMNSWDKMDSYEEDGAYILGENDLGLMENLSDAGPVHGKYKRMMPVWVTLTAPLYWWKEFDTYKVGTVCNSCSTMHKIHSKEFELDDFSHEDLSGLYLKTLCNTIIMLNDARAAYNQLKGKEYRKCYWDYMIALLPTSYNQKRTVMLNYEVLTGIYRDRKNHKLKEWHTFCEWIESLPYANELIIGFDEDFEIKALDLKKYNIDKAVYKYLNDIELTDKEQELVEEWAKSKNIFDEAVKSDA